MNGASALEQARATLAALGLPAALPDLRAQGVFLRRSIIGGTHSVGTYPPLDALQPTTPQDVLDVVRYRQSVNLYVHVAFCETRCTFCHYVVEHYPGRPRSSSLRRQAVSRYLAALEREMTWWGARLRESGTSVSSIYIGGGTPLVLEIEELDALIATIFRTFDVLPGSEFCIEGSPLTITAPDGPEKLRQLASRGVTRLSFGVQSFDDAVLKGAARAYREDTAVHACEIATAVFDNWNLDLIQGLYDGSPDEVLHNIAALAGVRPSHVTWYRGRFAPESPQGRWYADAPIRTRFEDDAATLVGRMLLWQEMERVGYQQVDGNRFVRQARYVDPFRLLRTSASSDLLGLGASSYSHVDMRTLAEGRGAGGGIMFRNTTAIPDYVTRIQSGTSPIASAFALTDEEWLASPYVVGLRTGRIEDASVRALREAQPEVAGEYRDLEARLTGLGLIEPFVSDRDERGVRLSRRGRLFEDEILALFYGPAVLRAQSRRQLWRVAPHDEQRLRSVYG